MKYFSLLLLLFIVFFSSCVAQIQSGVEATLSTRREAIETKDLDLFLTTVADIDPYYRNEQARWFTEMTTEGMRDYSFNVIEIEKIDADHARAVIRQEHFFRKPFSFEYPIRYIKVGDAWLDAGYDFQEKKTDRYTVRYMEGEKHVDDFIEMIDGAYLNLEGIFEEKPDDGFIFKLFRERELLRQRSIPSIGWLFTGWGEADESLKLYTGNTPVQSYLGTIQHELIHHITMGICNNNLQGWLADGIALHYGNFQVEGGGNPLSLGYADKAALAVPVSFLEDADVWDESEQSGTWSWYDASAMYFAYMLESRGHDGVMELFYAAGEKPYNRNVMNPNFSRQNNATFSEVLKSEWGISKAELEEGYLTWLEQL